MRTVALALLTSTLLFAPPASARDRDGCDGSLDLGSGLEAPARWAPRQDSHSAHMVITTHDGKVELVLTPWAVAFQLSERKMASIERELRDEQNSDDNNPFAEAIKTAVFAGVRVLLKHSAECRIRDLRDVDYVDGRLEFVTRDGDRVFGHIDDNRNDVLASFDEHDARAFVREFRRLKARDR